MSTEAPRRGRTAPPRPSGIGVEVVPAAPEQESVLANLLELYSHDFSEFVDLELDADGRFGYPWLPLYWTEEDRWPFLVLVDGKLAGFVFVTRGSPPGGDPAVYDMAEFFIVRGQRKRGFGTEAARLIWRRFPGPWRVRVIGSNRPALAFWRSALAGLADAGIQESSLWLHDREWRVFSFTA
jgi:predicted acetyltransferase